MKTVLTWLNILRLAGFSLGYGLTGALVGGTLNRVMIADLGIGASLVGIFFAVPLFVSPVRVWLGYRSDGYLILGKRREPYIIVGALLSGVGVALATFLALQMTDRRTWLMLGVLLAFVIYGFGRNLGHNTFQALLSDRFHGDARPRAITGYEVATLLGLVIGAGGLGAALEQFDPARLVTVTLATVSLVFVLSLLAAVQQEPDTHLGQAAAEKARQVPFGEVIRSVVMADPQVRLFFALVVFTFIGTLAQDVLLEPYGALVLGMAVGDTTRLTAFWGVGVLISMALSGAVLIKFLGYMPILRLGLIMSILVFIGLIITGWYGDVGVFRNLVFVMGLGTGLAGAGMLTIIINFTSVIRAGLLMGVWGFANLLGRAAGSVIGGSMVDLVLWGGGSAFTAYAAVFALEAILLLVALYLSTRLNIGASQVQREVSETFDDSVGATALT